MSEVRKARILCAEDEQDIRENIADILRDEGFEVFEAANGKLAFESFLQNKPDLVISDIMMPELDGYGLLELIRGSKNTRNNTVPFIFLSALGQKENVLKGVNSSANDYLIKPIDFDLMIAKVREKTENSIKVQQTHERSITNLKSQVATILPNELFSYLDIISQVSAVLKEEPYGPFPHRRYIEELDKIYLNALKLRSSINNSLDQSVISQRLNANEEIFPVTSFVEEFIAGLSEKFRSKITFERPFEESTAPKLKMDKLILLDAFRKIFAGMFKADAESQITVAVMNDHLDQMVIIFYLKSKEQKSNLANTVDSSQISKILDKQNCRFEVVQDKEGTAILTIPSYRLLK